jgi:hypothetical protein
VKRTNQYRYTECHCTECLGSVCEKCLKKTKKMSLFFPFKIEIQIGIIFFFKFLSFNQNLDQIPQNPGTSTIKLFAVVIFAKKTFRSNSVVPLLS